MHGKIMVVYMSSAINRFIWEITLFYFIQPVERINMKTKYSFLFEYKLNK